MSDTALRLIVRQLSYQCKSNERIRHGMYRFIIRRYSSLVTENTYEDIHEYVLLSDTKHSGMLSSGNSVFQKGGAIYEHSAHFFNEALHHTYERRLLLIRKYLHIKIGNNSTLLLQCSRHKT